MENSKGGHDSMIPCILLLVIAPGTGKYRIKAAK